MAVRVALLDAERAHNVAIWAAVHGLLPIEKRSDPPILRTTVWGKHFSNPIGLAAGFDKDAQALEGLLGLGFGFVEIGSVTPLPQPGNDQPRAFRIPELKAVINRYGFNSQGLDVVRANLIAYRRSQLHRPANQPGPGPGLVGVNLGKNKLSEDAAADYCLGVSKLAPYADYLVINVSSPNTPGLRALQSRKELEKLVRKVKATRDGMSWGAAGPPPLLVKIAPDITDADKSDIAAVALKLGIDGLIVSNTTICRPPAVAEHPEGKEAGGLSGAPLRFMSTEVLRDMYRLTKGKLPIIGVGGVSSGADAYAKIRAGASLVELYTGLVYEGPILLRRMKLELTALLQRDGFASVHDAIGADHAIPKR
ncbi:dihydropryrimidine dehydrogenase [Coccomyxa subellipsoidea C-169]|uniref:Dihydroorotate dehydrogenase (quinone), mitochondrial n=1 Tax=Coccomyxa subellipsoidea (strain C-169) TaxID=574566 RepID=I0YMR5_COCSC|nr:dihydropryrimidine dehydrogenase [Coccomyxa subellipsoidea C-169]EIE19684.1 dihydropryrimidine dehydrogenase [Coccomyxa subellipsoidea C-169]|eukprot:XP_005644228.1 dihydropryrimidine dehydrogenase [Coccomyxa subellipsoidea C-169]